MVYDVTGQPALENLSERKQEQRALRRYAERLATLRSIDQLILAASSAEDLAVHVLPQIRHLVGCDHLNLVEADHTRGGFRVLGTSSGLETSQSCPDAPQKLARGPLTEKLLRGEVVVIEDLNELAATPVFARWLLENGVRSLTAFPLQANGQLIGALLAGMAHPGLPDTLPPGEETLEILHDVADQLAIGLHQVRLREQISRHTAELEQTVTQRTAALQASEASLSAIFEQSPTGIFTATLQGRITRHNAALSRMLDFEQGALDGVHLGDLDHPEDHEEAQARFSRLAAGETPDYQVEQRYRRRDGSVMQGQLTVSLVRSAEGTPAFVFGLLEDITDQKRAHEALLQAEKLSVTGQLVAAVTHEINNPLQTVIGCMGLLQESLDDASLAQANPYLSIALEELRRIGLIVGELRDLHRRSGPDDMEPTDITKLINRVVNLGTYKAEERSIQIEWSPPDEGRLVLPLVPSRIHQVFLNVMLNAMDAMPDGGRIRITMTRTTKPLGVKVNFSDTGIGIDPNLVPHLFEPFYTTKSTGMGMGLYICRSIVHEHQGKIDVESTPGRGTTFSIWLPRKM